MASVPTQANRRRSLSASTSESSPRSRPSPDWRRPTKRVYPSNFVHDPYFTQPLDADTWRQKKRRRDHSVRLYCMVLPISMTFRSDSRHLNLYTHLLLCCQRLTCTAQPHHLLPHLHHRPPSSIFSRKGYMMWRDHTVQFQPLIHFLSDSLHLRAMIWPICQIFDLMHSRNFTGLWRRPEKGSSNACATTNSCDPNQIYIRSQNGDVSRLMECYPRGLWANDASQLPMPTTTTKFKLSFPRYHPQGALGAKNEPFH
jgi:hypothetical protein